MKKDMELIAAGHEPVRPWLVNLFFDMDVAESRRVSENVEMILTAAKSGTWQAAAWWLERTHPAEFGRKSDVTMKKDQESVNPRIQINQVILGNDAARAASRDLLRHLSSGASAPVPIGPGDGGELEPQHEDIDVDTRSTRRSAGRDPS